MEVLKSQNWLHYSELESYIRELLEQVSQYSCYSKEKACLNQSDFMISASNEIRQTVQFDLITKGELVLFTPIYEWLSSLSYCYIQSIKLKYLSDSNGFTHYASSIMLELGYCPCKHRNGS